MSFEGEEDLREKSKKVKAGQIADAVGSREKKPIHRAEKIELAILLVGLRATDKT